MAVPTLIAAILLIVVGVTGYVNQNPETMSPTALIPAFIGGALAICGLLAFKDGLRKHAMHAAAAIALVGGIAALSRILGRVASGKSLDFSEPAVVSTSLTTLICFVLLAMCVNSFIQARKARRSAASPSA